jgi:hypothetical protein
MYFYNSYVTNQVRIVYTLKLSIFFLVNEFCEEKSIVLIKFEGIFKIDLLIY